MAKNLSKRDLILMAASSIIRNEGVSQLTLEAVANKAGVSKGGLLYHFPNKEALIQAMIDDLTDNYLRAVESRLDPDQNPKGKWSRAYVEATFREIEDGLNTSSGLLAAYFTNPELLQKFQNQYAIWQEKIDNEGSVNSMIARLAADGLWFAELFGLAPIKKEQRDRVMHELLGSIMEGDK